MCSRRASFEFPSGRCWPVVDVAAASGVDTCWYDLVADDEFILGAVPGADGLYTGSAGAARATSSRPGWAGS